MFMFRNKVQNSFHSLGKKKQTNKKIKIWKVDHGVVWNLNMTEHDENPNNTVSSTVFNPQVCTDDALKKGISSWFFFSESLARLAYNKGTALFRGNDPFSKTFSLTHHPHRQTQENMLDRSGDRKVTERLVHSTCPRKERVHQEGTVSQKRLWQ